MKVLLWLFLVYAPHYTQDTITISKVRSLYRQAPLAKPAARELSELLNTVDSSYRLVLQCYKGAGVMIQAKYAISPVVKLEKFNKGKGLIQRAISRDSLDLEMRFIRFSVQSNLPAFLGYHDELAADKRFLQQHTGENGDSELKAMIAQYLTSLPAKKQEEIK